MNTFNLYNPISKNNSIELHESIKNMFNCNGINNSSDKLTRLDETHLTQIFSNTDKYLKRQTLNEGVVSQDVAQFTPLLLPLLRHAWPRLIGKDLLGVQPMSTPTGYIFAFVGEYRADAKDERTNLIIYELNKPVTEKKDDDIDGETVVHSEGNYVLITVKDEKSIKRVGDALGSYTVVNRYSNALSFHKILTNYSKADVTDELRPKINSIGFRIVRKSVEAEEFSIRGEFSVEMYQDLKSQHGAIADEEMMKLMSSKVVTDIDAYIINFVNENATQKPDLDLSSSTDTEIEKARKLQFKIADMAADVGRLTNRGRANILLVSSRVHNRIAALDGYLGGPVDSDLSKVGATTGFQGTLDGNMRVYIDPYAQDDYATVLYRGEDNFDAMGYFCPYTGITFIRGQNTQNANSVIFLKTRFALTTVPGLISTNSNDRAALYAQRMTITGLSS